MGGVQQRSLERIRRRPALPVPNMPNTYETSGIPKKKQKNKPAQDVAKIPEQLHCKTINPDETLHGETVSRHFTP